MTPLASARRIVANTFQITEHDLRDSDHLNSFPEWDSLGHLELVVALEKETGVEIVNSDSFELVTSLEGIATYLERFHE
jgi:acyl carrier protein